MNRFKRILWALGALAALMPTPTYGDEAQTHLVAHLGVSFAIDAVGVDFSQRALRMTPLQAETFSAFSTIFIGLIYKASEDASGADTLRATWQNGLGIGLGVLSRSMFRWEF